MVLKIFFYVLSFHLFFSTNASARWGTIADAPSSIEFFHQDIEVIKDGKQIETIEILLKVLNEEGRNSEGIQRLSYNETNEKLKILEAKTIFDLDEKKIQLLSEGHPFSKLEINFQNVEKNMIEKQAVLSESASFDSISQFVLSYPNIKVNSWIYLKTKRTIFQSPLPDYFSTNLSYQGVWNRSRMTLRSEIPFKILVHDVDKNLSIEESSENKIQTLKVTQKKPIIQFLINEPGSSFPDEKQLTFVNISTHSDFKNLGNALAK